MPGIPWTDVIDPRSREVACASPIERSVNIPADEIASRGYELPAPGSLVRLARVEGHEFAALQLSERYVVELVEPTFGESGAYRLWRPCALVEEILATCPPGRAIDFGCGSGRDAVELAAAGWSVLGIDRLPDALEMAGSLSKRYRVEGRTQWKRANVTGAFEPGLRSADLALFVRFFDLVAVQRGLRALSPAGYLAVMSFSPTHHAATGHPELRRVADLEVLRGLAAWDRILVSEERELSDGNFTCFLAQIS